MVREKIEAYFEGCREAMVQDICKLIRVNSEPGTPKEGMPFGEGPAEALRVALEMAAAMGFKTKNYDGYVGAIDMNDHPKQLDILAHLDVVPAGENWKIAQPYDPVIQDGKIYGRGAADDKGPAVAALYAMKAVKDLGIPLRKNVRLILGTDEECGSSDIAYYYSKEPEAPMTFSPDAEFPVINIEKGGLQSKFFATYQGSTEGPRVLQVSGGYKANMVPDRAKAIIEGLAVTQVQEKAQEVTEKTGVQFFLQESQGRVEIEAHGIGAHASTPEQGKNAITALMSLLIQLPFAPSEGFSKLQAVNEIFPHGDWDGVAAGVAMEDAESGKLTISFDIFHYGDGKLEGVFDCRAPLMANNENLGEVLEAKMKALGITLEKKEMYPPHHVPADSPFVQTLLKCYETYSGKKGYPIAIGGGTYVHGIKNGVAFGCATLDVDNRMHGADEFAEIDQLILSAKIFAQAIIELCQ